MGLDWLKVQKSTPTKPEVFAIAERLNITPGDAFWRLVRVWCWFDDESQDGVTIPQGTVSAVDHQAGLNGFGEAMKAVGWLQNGSAGLLIPNGERWLGDSAKRRAIGAAKQAHKRTQNRTQMRTPKRTLPEGTRSSSVSSSSSSSASSSSDGFDAFWSAWPRSHRKASKGQCLAVWVKRGLADKADRVMAGLVRWKASQDWCKDDGQFIPAPLVWLNQDRWDSDATGPVLAKPEVPYVPR